MVADIIGLAARWAKVTNGTTVKLCDVILQYNQSTEQY